MRIRGRQILERNADGDVVVIDHDGQLYSVPRRRAGWHDRTRFEGKRNKLREADVRVRDMELFALPTGD